MIQITDLKFDKYNITYNINLKNKTGIFFTNSHLTKKFLSLISGINKINNIYFHSRKVFDNKEYFSHRIYLDCSKQYLNTLDEKRVAKAMQDGFNITINEDKFKELVELLDIRMEGKLLDSYKFNLEGIALGDIALGISSFKQNILLYPFENIKNIEKIDLIKNELISKGVVVGVKDLKRYDNFLDTIMFFSDYKMHIFNKDDKVLVINNVVSRKLLIEASKIDDLIIYKSNTNESFIILNDLDRDQMKVFNEYKVKILEVSIFNIGDYLC